MNITAFMPLFSRPLHTLRWLWHVNRTAFPFPILFGDGGDEPIIRRILENPDNFPNLNYKYMRYEGCTVSDFFVRCAAVLSKVETPYVIWCDNDDFPVVSGILKAAQKLDSNSAASCAGGWIGKFVLYEPSQIKGFDRITGELYRYDMTFKRQSVINTTAMERVSENLLRHRSNWHCLHRKESLHTSFEQLKNSGITGLDFAETYIGNAILTHGHTLIDGSYPHIYRQRNTSIAGPLLKSVENQADDPAWRSDLSILISDLSKAIALVDGIQAADVERDITSILETRIRQSVLQRGEDVAFLHSYKNSMLKVARLVLRIKPVRSYRLNREREAMLSNFSASGADQEAMSLIRRELAEIEETLTGKEFPEFVRRIAPELLEGG